jgi:hypothetical protein
MTPMVRLKFAIFAIAVLTLWIWRLYALAPPLSAVAVEAASTQAARSPAGLELKIDERRRELQRAAQTLASAPAAVSSFRTRAEPPLPEKFGPLRSAALESVPESYRPGLVVALHNEQGTIYARGSAEPVAEAKDLDPASLIAAGSEGVWRQIFGASHLFFSFPVMGMEKGEPKVLGNLLLGAPLPVDNLLEVSAKESGLGALALLENGKIIALAGPEKAQVERLDKALPPGKTAVAARSGLSSLGPFKFPVGTDGDPLGGGGPLWIGSRQSLRSTPYEVIGWVSVRPVMEVLGAYQRTALLLFMALLALSAVWFLILEGMDYRIPPRVREYEIDRDRTPVTSPAPSKSGATPLSDELPPVPESAMPAAATEEPPSDSAAFDAEAKEGESSPPAAPSESYLDPDQPTMAYPAPDALTARNEGTDGVGGEEELYNPDATRVAEIPEELLRASARSESSDGFQTAEPVAQPRAAPVSSAAPPNDEQHFREVFSAFLSTRQKCGEPADSLTFDRFAQKLRKNRDQLMEKYNCRTVRFHVYVKEGKAALKATPVNN